ncbi:trophozoite exported protein 1-like isoform X2 [Linepithema humile]|uniref:trophozoite exported protein 1-like isoform X2 n=1 Tax=Linepithema humile TaxID=83485 RepID=UPI0006238D15|nr:PREDICTED: uncharacterized protein LOC105678548 isoform X2 [Linepithema humile]
MSENTFEEKNNSFKDYRTNSFDDGDLQTRLYAEIYYESNNQEELKTTNIPKMVQFDNICNELNIVPESVHKPEDKQYLESKGARKQLTYNDTLQVQNPLDPHVPIQVQTCNDKEANSGQEANSMDDECNSMNNKSYSAVKEKENSVKKHKSSNYTKKKHQKSLQEDNTVSLNDSVSEVIYSKYSIRQKSEKQEMLSAKQDDKDQQISDGSDSEVSIFEVPIPPKPKPLLIDLQDSDEEKSVDKDNLHQKALKITNTSVPLAGINNELEVQETSSYQVISSKNKNTSKSQRNKNTVNVDKITQTTTHTQEVSEDIVLNCSPIKKVTNSISEIRQLSKDTEINQDQRNTLMENIKYKKKTPQKTKKYSENNDNLQQDTHMISSKRKLQTKKTQQNLNINNTGCNVYDLGHKDQDFSDNMLVNIPCSDKNKATKEKRKCNSPIISNVKHKRQCIIQQSSQNITLQDNNDKERREGDKYFTPMSQEMKDYYCNSTRGQENFDISELQRNMSKDPKMWKISDEDLMPRPCNRQRNRFWKDKCHNCHQDGHHSYDCTVKRRICCRMCSEKGHTKFRCSWRMCLTCGHEANQCPDLWRRYHQTTDMSNMPQDVGNTMKPPNLLYCCNCNKRGHESSTCKEEQMTPHHFVTPATVTNYTDGPTYNPNAAISSECYHHTMNISPSEAASSETSIPRNVNMQEAMEEHSGLSANVNLSPLSEEANKVPISQEAMNIPQTEKIVKTDKISENQKTKELTYIINEKIFINVIYSCGKFLHKNNKKSRMICQNLSMLALSSYGKTTIANLEKRKVFPSFLEALNEKHVPFEVKIGFTACQRKNVMLQLITVGQSLELIYELLLHWINLPNEEKVYGIDITLPRNSTKMFNLLSTRMPQFKKMGFTSYDNDLCDPQNMFLQIKSKKTELEKERKGKYKKESIKEYCRERTKLWRMQVKLLMIANTEPEPNKYVYMLQNAMKELELKQYQMSEELDIVTYLKFTLLYNILFVPHTPIHLYKMLYRFRKHATNKKLFNMQQRQELDREISEQENHALCTNMNLSFPPITPSTSQDINLVENLSAVNIQQNASNNITNDILPINDATNNNRDETMINDPTVQIPPFIITSFNTESATVPSEDFTSDINVESTVSTSGQNAQSAMPQKQTKSEEKRFKKPFANEKFNKKNQKKKNVYKKALEIIEQAREFKVSHIINAADDLRRKVTNQILTSQHVAALEKLIRVEKKYQKAITSCCNSLKT